MDSLRELVEALPERGAKAVLRGMVTASLHADQAPSDDMLQRMRELVRGWREREALTRLERRLDELLSGDRAHSR